MNFVFFDVECANCYNSQSKICSFGYVVTDENFKVLKKEDILIDPNSEFQPYVLKHVIQYKEEEFLDKPRFNMVYNTIKDFLTNPKWRKDGAYLAKNLSTLVQSTDSVFMKNVKIGGVKYKKWSHKMEEKIFGNGKIHELIKKVVKEAENTEDLFVRLNNMVKDNFSKETYKRFSKAMAQCFV